MSIHADYTGNATRNVYGHRNTSAAAALDALLTEGATAATLAATRSSWREHIAHLRTEHGVNIAVTAQHFYRIV